MCIFMSFTVQCTPLAKPEGIWLTSGPYMGLMLSHRVIQIHGPSMIHADLFCNYRPCIMGTDFVMERVNVLSIILTCYHLKVKLLFLYPSLSLPIFIILGPSLRWACSCKPCFILLFKHENLIFRPLSSMNSTVMSANDSQAKHKHTRALCGLWPLAAWWKSSVHF